MFRANSRVKSVEFLAVVILIIKIIQTNSIYDIAVFFCAMLVHELFHFICAKCVGINVSLDGIGVFGLNIRMEDEKSLYKKLLVCCGGVVGNFMCAAISVLYSSLNYGVDTYYFTCCNLLVAAINLIPSFPLDGGRIVYCIFEYFFGSTKAVKYASTIGNLIAIVIFVFGIYVFLFYTDNVLLPVLGIFMIYRNEKEINTVNTQYIKSLLSS